MLLNTVLFVVAIGLVAWLVTGGSGEGKRSNEHRHGDRRSTLERRQHVRYHSPEQRHARRRGVSGRRIWNRDSEAAGEDVEHEH